MDILPVPVISLLLRSKVPPSLGEGSIKTEVIPATAALLILNPPVVTWSNTTLVPAIMFTSSYAAKVSVNLNKTLAPFGNAWYVYSVLVSVFTLVTVQIPPAIGVTFALVPKLIVCAVPIKLLSSYIL